MGKVARATGTVTREPSREALLSALRWLESIQPNKVAQTPDDEATRTPVGSEVGMASRSDPGAK